MSINMSPRDDYELREKQRKAPSITCAKITKWMIYNNMVPFSFSTRDGNVAQTMCQHLEKKKKKIASQMHKESFKDKIISSSNEF